MHPELLANIVLVKKLNEKLRIYVDFTVFNKACPKNNFSLPKSNKLLDSLTKFEYVSFLDVDSGYHQIPMHLDDKKKISSIINKRAFCYWAKPFILKNVKDTYIGEHSFKSQLGKNIKSYIVKEYDL